jgi:hypothetical protein
MTMPSLIVVEPAGDAWAVRSSLSDNPMLYRTGARAESAARDLAHRLADAGEPVVLEIRLRDGASAGRFLFPPRIRGEIVAA